MSSREEFMRSLGISVDEMKKPDDLQSEAHMRAEQRNALRAQKNPNASSVASAGSASSAPSVARKPTATTIVEPEPTPAAYSSSRYESDVPKRSSYAGGVSSSSSASAAAAAAFMNGGVGAGSAAPSRSSAAAPSAGPASGQSRADFLRSLGIDNAEDGSRASADVPPPQPRASAASIRDTLRRTEQNAHEEEAESPNISRKAPTASSAASSAHYGPRTVGAAASSSSAAGASPMAYSASSSSAAAIRREAASPAIGAGLDSSFSRLDRQGSASSATAMRRGSSSGNLNGSVSRLDSSTSGIGGPAVPLLDVAGNEVPLDASAEDYKKHGNAFYEQGDFRKAVRFYSRAIEKAPHNEVLYSNRSAGYLLASKQMAIDTRAMALRDADKCIELKPQWFKGYSRRGDALFKLERFDEACDAYRAALERDPGNAAIMASLDQCKACCAPKKDSSFAWSQPNDPFMSSSRAAADGSSRRSVGGSAAASGGSGSSSLNNSKSAYEMMEEFRVQAARATGSSSGVPNAADYRERELAKYREQRGGMRTSTASGGSDSLNNTTSGNNNNDSSFSSSRSAGGAGAGAGVDLDPSGAAAAYQASLLEAYRRKKATQQ